MVSFFFFFKQCIFLKFIYFWLRWVLATAHGPSPAVASWGYCLPCGARAPGVRAPAAAAGGLSSCGARAQPLHSLRDPPGSGPEPASPAWAGRLPTAAPPGKPPKVVSEHVVRVCGKSWRRKVKDIGG